MDDRIDVRKTHKMFIDGNFARSESGRTYNLTTQDSKESINICHASRKDFRDSVSAAKNALSGWSARTAYNRAQIIYRCAEILEGRSAQFIEELRAQGLNPEDAHKEVRKSIDLLVYYAGWADKYGQLFSSVNPVSAPYFNFTVLEATGVVAIIAPQESGLLGIIAAIAPALVGGNTCVTLISQERPLCASSLAETLHTSDIPAGVVNLLTGFRSELIEPFATHMEVNALLYFGEDNDEITQIETNAAENVKRVSICTKQDWKDESSLSPYAILRTQESKTTWHPIGY
jgi:acyl-CoA reductase-like NAD-dependent aldehyde dehydrogenase